MGWLENAEKTQTNQRNSMINDLGLGPIFGLGGTSGDSLAQELSTSQQRDLWSVAGADWHKVFAYQFSVRNENGTEKGKSEYFFTLPIPPQNYVLKPVIPARVTPTVGGVVEEASQTSFWLITMSGTTGTGVSRGDGDEVTRKMVAKKFRERIKTTGLLAGVSANLNQSVSKLGGVADRLIEGGTQTAKAFEDGNVLGGLAAASGGLVGAANTAMLPPLPYSGSAVKDYSNGFTEIHELHKFFHIYQKLKGMDSKAWSLWFTDYKSGQRWRVIIRDFSIQKNSQNPFLSRYNIALQGWNLQPTDAKSRSEAEYDRFGSGGDLAPVNTVSYGNLEKGLDAVNSKLGFGKAFMDI